MAISIVPHVSSAVAGAAGLHHHQSGAGAVMLLVTIMAVFVTFYVMNKVGTALDRVVPEEKQGLWLLYVAIISGLLAGWGLIALAWWLVA